MKLKDFKCINCGHLFEELVQGDQELVACPQCGATTTEQRLTGCHALTGGAGRPATSSAGCAPRGGFG
jgi:putative FmdB family regulatory protein